MADDVFEIPPLVPVFPLPSIVLFPHTIVPLHIFEPRYRAMMTDALASDRTIGIALLKPGFEPLYYTSRAPIHTTIGIGRVVEWEQIEDGDYNLLLRGVGRAVILDEQTDQPYRVARVEPLETYCSGAEEHSRALCSELFGEIRDNPALDRHLRRNWLRLSEVPLNLDELSDFLAAGLPADPELRQCLLDEPDALLRGRILLGQFRTLAALTRNARRVLPPEGHGLN